MTDLEFILLVKEISISEVCKNENISYSNLIRGKTTKENEKKIADILKLKINNIYSSIVLDRRV